MIYSLGTKRQELRRIKSGHIPPLSNQNLHLANMAEDVKEALVKSAVRLVKSKSPLDMSSIYSFI